MPRYGHAAIDELAVFGKSAVGLTDFVRESLSVPTA